MTMGDRVAVIRKGELQQVAPPQELYDHPVNLFVGGFIGSPAMNMVEAMLERDDGRLSVQLGSQRLSLDDELLSTRPGLKAHEGRQVILGIRPEDLEDAALASDAPSDRRLHGVVQLREALGAEIIAHFTVDARPALTEDVRELAQDVGDERSVQLEESATEMTMVGRFGSRSTMREGAEAEVAVDTRELHFFDPETGLGIYDDETSTKGVR
jgi:multiple sugar transport system ATP-binding protein